MKKIVLFSDEFPWLATHKSGLIQALDYYWNRFWVSDRRIKLVICGSAAAWIIKNLLHNKGGLHNRVTERIHLEPFTLYETKQYLKYRGTLFDNSQILLLYLCIGGIPYYLNKIEKRLSVIQNINQLCFQKKGTLLDEFQELFSSLFEHADIHEAIIRKIASRPGGLARSELGLMADCTGGRLTQHLRELEEAGFIIAFTPWGKQRGTYKQIFVSMITACRLKKTLYTEELINSEATLNDLFKG